MLNKEIQYYSEHEKDLLSKYHGKFVVIAGSSFVGAFDSNAEAYQHAIEHFEAGTFLIRHCVATEEQQKVVFHSRVSFA